MNQPPSGLKMNAPMGSLQITILQTENSGGGMTTSSHSEWRERTFHAEYDRLISQGLPSDRAKYMAQKYSGSRPDEATSWLRRAGK